MKGFAAGCAPGWRLSVAALVAVLGAVALPLSGCSSSDATPPARTVAEESTTSTSTATTTVEQSYAVPEVIDIAYVNRVLAALDEIYGQVARVVFDKRQLAPEDLVPLRAIFNDPLFEAQAQGFAMLPASDPATLRKPVGNRQTTATRVFTATEQCIHVEVEVDISAVVVDPPPPRVAYLELRPTQPGADAKGLNPTPWSISNEDQAQETRCD